MPSLSNAFTPSSGSTVGATSTSGHRRVADGSRHAGTGNHQRHPQRGVVDEQAVRHLAVLAERFTVIGGDDDQRPRRSLAQRLQRPARPAGPPPPPRRHTGRSPAVRSVRRRTARAARTSASTGSGAIQRSPAARRSPRRRHHSRRARWRAGPECRAACGRRRWRSRHSGRSGDRAETRRRTRRSRIPRLPALPPATARRASTLHAVVPGAVTRRVAAGQQRGVRRQRDRRRRERAREADAAARQRVDVRGPRLRVAVGADAIRAQRVDRDEDEVARPLTGGRVRRRGRRFVRPAAGGRGQCDRQQREACRRGSRYASRPVSGALRKRISGTIAVKVARSVG